MNFIDYLMIYFALGIFHHCYHCFKNKKGFKEATERFPASAILLGSFVMIALWPVIFISLSFLNLKKQYYLFQIKRLYKKACKIQKEFEEKEKSKNLASEKYSNVIKFNQKTETKTTINKN